MLLATTILLLCPFPQIAGTAKTETADTAVVSSDSSSDATSRNATSSDAANGDATSNDATKDVSQPLPSAPEPKVKTDVEVAAFSEAMEPGYLPAAQPAKPLAGVKMSVSRPYETATQRRVWYALSFTGSGAAAFDAWSTRRAISSGYGTEANPLLRPFSHSGAMYAATQVSPLVMDFVGKHMMISSHKWVRNLWWLPQSAGTSFSLYAGVHNTRLVP
jgi:hypothetical protein